VPRSTPRSSLRGDIAGGIAGGILTVPTSIGYGVLALGALGDAYVAPAVLAGLYSAVVVSFVVLVLGEWKPVSFAPRSIIAVLFAAMVVHTLVPAVRVAPLDVDRTLALLVVIVTTAGLFQAVFGLLRLGNAIRYIPSPVMAGFQNAVALLLLVAQVNALLGFRSTVPLFGVPSAAAQIRPLAAVVGVVTALVIWYAPRVTRRIPSPIAGLVAGAALHHVLSLLGLGASLGPMLGGIPAVFPSFTPLATLPSLVGDAYLRARWPSFLGAAASLALVASLDTLLCAKTAEGITGQRSQPNAQLLRVGAGNIVAGFVGAIPSSINLGSTSALYRAGGRTGLAPLVCALFVLAATIGLAPVIALIPRAAIAGVLTIVALQLFDRASLRRLWRLFRHRDDHWRVPALDLFVVTLVAAVTIALDLVWAVSVGVAVAILLFLYRMSRSIVRRTYRGDAVRSKRMLEPRLMEFLSQAGRQIMVFELEGPIFFGTAEKLAGRIELAVRSDVVFVILDLRRVNELDSTGAAILAQTARRLRDAGKQLLLSHLHDNAFAVRVARDAGLTTPRDAAFVDTDAALESAEDALIARQQGLEVASDELPLSEIPLLAGLSEAEQAVVAAGLDRIQYKPGEVVIRQGDPDRRLYIVARGAATVRVNAAGTSREIRLASYARGTMFGEMALLDRQPRSATITADNELVCYVLSEAAFDSLIAQRPVIAVRLLANIARELSGRLRNATRTISELER
jgi:MFS superfamily sulfate permease-like transporter